MRYRAGNFSASRLQSPKFLERPVGSFMLAHKTTCRSPGRNITLTFAWIVHYFRFHFRLLTYACYIAHRVSRKTELYAKPACFCFGNGASNEKCSHGGAIKHGATFPKKCSRRESSRLYRPRNECSFALSRRRSDAGSLRPREILEDDLKALF